MQAPYHLPCASDVRKDLRPLAAPEPKPSLVHWAAIIAAAPASGKVTSYSTRRLRTKPKIIQKF